MEQPDPVVAQCNNKLWSGIRGTVRNDSHVKPIGRIVERQGVAQLGFYMPSLITSRDQHVHRGPFAGLRRGWPWSGYARQQYGVSNEGIADQRYCAPEQHQP